MDGRKEDSDETSKTDDKSDSGGDDDDDFAAVQRFRQWERDEQRRRNLRALAVTDYAISHFAPLETDPERHLALAMVYYNRPAGLPGQRSVSQLAMGTFCLSCARKTTRFL